MSIVNENINDALIIAYLNGEELPAKQREQITLWLQDPANKLNAQDAYRAWELSMLAKEDVDDIDLQWEKMNHTITASQQPQNQSKSKWWWSAAAILLLSTISFIGYFKFPSQPIASTDLKAEHSKQNYTLPDETKVTLDTQAVLSFDDNQLSSQQAQRIVSLIGNAYFEVRPDKEQPFIIQRPDAEIQVLGTKFYVSSDEAGGTVVNVVEGSVRVKYLNPNRSFVLKANEKIEANQEEVSEAEWNSFFWNTRILSFQNDPLTKVFDEISDHYGVTFQLKNKEIQDCLMTSQFEDLALGEILEVLTSIYQLEFEKKGNQLTVSGNGCH